VIDKQRRLVVVRVVQRMDQILAVGFEQLRRAVHVCLLHSKDRRKIGIILLKIS